MPNDFVLVTDRTLEDQRRAEYLATIDYAHMSESEQQEWNGNLKGAYGADDLNRVESAVGILSAELQALIGELKDYAAQNGVAWDKFFDLGYAAGDVQVITKSDWIKGDVPTSEQMVRYISNVRKLRNALKFATDELPTSMADLTYQGANAIERALVRLNEAIIEVRRKTMRNIENTAAAWHYSGEIYAGEVTP